jgi:hypothetical protein
VRAESGVEVLERLIEANLSRVERSHGCSQPIVGEIGWLDLACSCDQIHRAHGRLVVSVGEHVDVGVGHASAIELYRGLREAAVAQAPFAHQRTERLSK